MGIFEIMPASFNGSHPVNNFMWLLPEMKCDDLIYREKSKTCYHMQMMKEDMIINPSSWDPKLASMVSLCAKNKKIQLHGHISSPLPVHSFCSPRQFL